MGNDAESLTGVPDGIRPLGSVDDIDLYELLPVPPPSKPDAEPARSALRLAPYSPRQHPLSEIALVGPTLKRA